MNEHDQMTLEQMLADLELECIYRLKMFLLSNGYRVRKEHYSFTETLITKCGFPLVQVGWIDGRVNFLSESGLVFSPLAVDLRDLCAFVDKITDGKSL